MNNQNEIVLNEQTSAIFEELVSAPDDTHILVKIGEVKSNDFRIFMNIMGFSDDSDAVELLNTAIAEEKKDLVAINTYKHDWVSEIPDEEHVSSPAQFPDEPWK
ncbi:hypothetical protein JW979_12520, partial [bacterium]|nr:hypothetical protein [candidate division CSSED10-310 bacterium]